MTRADEEVEVPSPTGGRRRLRRRATPPADRRWIVGLLALAALPVVAALAGALADDRQPVGDEAVVALTAERVWSADTPRLGMPTSLAAASEAPVDDDRRASHHPGPMGFWPLGSALTVAGTSGLWWGAALWTVGWLAALVALAGRAGRPTAIGAAIGAAVLLGALGPDVIVGPWNPHMALAPLLVAAVAAWRAVSGDRTGLLVLVVATSAAAQLFVGNLVLAAALAVAGALGWAREARREDLRPTLAVAGALAVGLWALPLAQQVTGRPGNLTLLVEDLTGGLGPTRGLGWAIQRMLASIAPPTAARWGVDEGDALRLLQHPTVVATAAGALVVGAGAALGARAWRRGDTPVVAALVVAAVAVIALTLTLSQVPVAPATYRLRPLGPVAIATWLALALAVSQEPRVRGAARRWADRGPGAAKGAAAVVAAMAVAASFPPTAGDEVGPAGDSDVVRRIWAQAEPALARDEAFEVRPCGARGLLSTASGILWQVHASGRTVRLPASTPLSSDHPLVADVPATALIDVCTGVTATQARPDPWTEIARDDAADDATRAAEADARAALEELLLARPPTLTDAGRMAATRTGGPRGALLTFLSRRDEPARLVDRDVLPPLVERGLVDAPAVASPEWRRWETAFAAWAPHQTVVWTRPAPS